MPIDASIALGAKAPDTTQQLSGLLNVANTAQQVQSGGISLNERKAVSQVLSNPASYTDQEGNIDFTRAMPQIMQVAPTTGMKYVQDLMTAQKQHTEAQQSLNNLTTDVRSQAGKVLYGIPADAPSGLVHSTIDALQKQYKGGSAYWDALHKGYDFAAAQGKSGDFLANAAKTTLPQETQQAMGTPSVITVNDGASQTGFNIKPGVAGMPQGQPMFSIPNQVGPGGLEAVETDAQGNKFIATRTHSGAVVGTRPLQSTNPTTPGPFTLPPNETPDTLKDFQGQRDAARQAAVSAPVMHDINRTIISEANKGFNTGTLGALTQKAASATGYHLGPNESATDYNVLGKMLERSALVAAQSMGPHTNAGLEAAVRANGSLEYTPQALKKIAYLNDALTSGSELYNQGMEAAIKHSPNGVFAKRDFDAQWGKVATPQVLRLKNAVDSGNQEEVQNIVKEVGGKGTKGAQQLHQQLTKLLQLTGQ